MSLRLEMLQVARLAHRILGDSTLLVRDFFLRQQRADGSFPDRSGNSDLYYTVFGLEGLVAVHIPTLDGMADPNSFGHSDARAREYLCSFTNLGGLDFVHLCCLARAWAAANNLDSAGAPFPFREAVIKQLMGYQSADGGFNPLAGSSSGTAYGAFLGYGACQDLTYEFPQPGKLAESLNSLKAEEGGWLNERSVLGASSKQGATNATAAAIAVLRNLGEPVPPAAGEWLLRQVHPQGGFLAVPNAPMPDLLSTATALHSLSAVQIPFKAIQESCLDFVDSLWTNEGAFHGHWGDDHLDCEYTYYGLLALGHLSL